MTVTRFQRARALLGALALTLVLTGVLAPRAGAVLIHFGPHDRSVVGVLPHRGIRPGSIVGHFAPRAPTAAMSGSDNGTLFYGDGPVLHAEKLYLVFWDPGSHISTAEKSLFEQYYHDTAADSGLSTNVFGVLRQYTDASGFADYKQTWSSAQAITDTAPYPAGSSPRPACPNSSASALGTFVPETNCLTDAQLQTELERLVTADGLPSGVTGSAPIYAIVTPPLVNTCLDSSTCADNVYCAYHGATTTSPSPSTLLYADMPTLLDETSTKGCQADGNTVVQEPNPSADSPAVTDVAISSLSHELAETITDPVNGTGYTSASGNEIGDECAFTGAPADPNGGYNPNAFSPVLGGDPSAGSAYDQVINGDHYYTQTEWSNADLTCVAQPTAKATTARYTPTSGTITAGTAFSFNPTTSSSTGGYSSISWDYGDGATAYYGDAPTPRMHGSGAPTPPTPATVSHTYSALHASFTDGPANQLTNQPVSFDATASSSLGGTVQVKLTTVDTYGNISTVTHAFTVSGSGGPITSYTWDFGDGTAPQHDSTPTTTHAYASPGTYTVTLTIGDGTHTDATSQAITVDAPPIAAFTVTTPGPVATQAVSFDGTGSAEPGGTITAWSWSFGDGATGSGAGPSHVYPAPGTYPVSLTVTDQDGHQATTTANVIVGAPPTAAFAVSTGTPRADTPVGFDASASSEPGGAIASYAWSFGDGTAGTGVTPAHVYASPGTYHVILTVTDAHSHVATTSSDVVVGLALGVPLAAITVPASRPVAGAAVVLSGVGSTDAGSTLTSYTWSFGDGASATGTTPGHAYARPGAYTVTLTVRDATGQSSTTSRTVTVVSPSITAVRVRTGRTLETLTLTISGAGTLINGRTRIRVRRAGTATLKIRLTAGQRARLAGHHNVTIRLTLRFSPTVGRASRRQVRFVVRG